MGDLAGADLAADLAAADLAAVDLAAAAAADRGVEQERANPERWADSPVLPSVDFPSAQAQQ